MRSLYAILKVGITGLDLPLRLPDPQLPAFDSFLRPLQVNNPDHPGMPLRLPAVPAGLSPGVSEENGPEAVRSRLSNQSAAPAILPETSDSAQTRLGKGRENGEKPGGR